MNDFFGTLTHTLDAKMRLTIPAKMRRAIEAADEQFVVTRSAKNHLSLYPMNRWTEIVDKIDAMDSKSKSGARRRIIAQAAKLKFDASGRVLIPQNLRDVAGLTGDVTIAGMGKHLELWNAEEWSATLAQDEDDLDFDALEAVL